MRLYKRGKTWWIEYHLHGKYKRISTHLHDKTAAKAVLASMEQARTKTLPVDTIIAAIREIYGQDAEASGRKSTPIGSIWDIYEDTAKALGLFNMSATTLRKRKCNVKNLLMWIELERSVVESIEAVTGPIAAGYASYLAKDGKSTKTRKNILTDLGTVWRVLSKHVEGISNPWANLSPRDTDGKVGEAFTRDEEERIFAAAERIGNDWLPICKVMRHTGLRYGDVANLTWDEIDLDNLAIRVMPDKTKKHKIKVCVGITPDIEPIIRKLPKRGDYLFPIHAEMYGKTGHVHDEIINFRDVLDEAEVFRDGLTIHSWRHTAATRLAESGADKETRKRILGHTVDATADRYDHDDHLEQNRAAQIKAAK